MAVNEVWKFFSSAYTGRDDLPFSPLKTFSQEWALLPEADRVQIRTGVENGTLNY